MTDGADPVEAVLEAVAAETGARVRRAPQAGREVRRVVLRDLRDELGSQSEVAVVEDDGVLDLLAGTTSAPRAASATSCAARRWRPSSATGTAEAYADADGWYLASMASSLATLGEERPGSNSAASQWSRTFSAASGAMTRAPMVRTWASLDLRARSAE